MGTVYTNTTPWNTADLEKLLAPLVEGTGIQTITISTLTAMPGVKTEEQRQVGVNGTGYHPDFKTVVVELLSPKRVGKRVEALDRLSLVEDLKPHETALPEKAVAAIEHAFAALRSFQKRGRAANGAGIYEIRPCMVGECSCKYAVQTMVLIKGDTKARIKPPVTVEELERKLSWAQGTVDRRLEDLAEAMAQRDRLQERVARLRQKQGLAMTVPIGSHSGKEDGHGDEGEQEAE
jgi:hypothetical protein